MPEEMIKQLRMYLMDSLLARTGAVIAPDVVSEITNEFMGRVAHMSEEEE